MNKEGENQLEQKKGEVRYSKKSRLKNAFLFLGLFLLLLIIIWFALYRFRHNESDKLLANAQKQTDQKQKVLLIYEAKIISPLYYKPYLELGKFAYSNNDFSLGEKYLKTALVFNKNNPQIYFYLIDSLINQNKPNETNQYLENFELIDPNNPEIIFLKTRLAIANQKLDEAENLIAPIRGKDEKYEKYYLLFLLSEKKDAIIEKDNSSKKTPSLNDEQNLLFTSISQSKNDVFRLSKIGSEWIKLGENQLGCSLIAEGKNKNPEIFQKAPDYKQLSDLCHL